MTEPTARETRPGPWHRRLLQPLLLGALLATCNGGGGAPVAEMRVAEALIGPADGTLAFPAGRHAGVSA